jgi:hypothetical protein
MPTSPLQPQCSYDARDFVAKFRPEPRVIAPGRRRAPKNELCTCQITSVHHLWLAKRTKPSVLVPETGFSSWLSGASSRL